MSGRAAAHLDSGVFWSFFPHNPTSSARAPRALRRLLRHFHSPRRGACACTSELDWRAPRPSRSGRSDSKYRHFGRFPRHVQRQAMYARRAAYSCVGFCAILTLCVALYAPALARLIGGRRVVSLSGRAEWTFRHFGRFSAARSASSSVCAPCIMASASAIPCSPRRHRRACTIELDWRAPHRAGIGSGRLPTLCRFWSF